MLLPAEQARSAMFQAADAIRRADAGEEGAYALARILTPLLKFRACRDARRVTGDAMEVRGGCGYIEEWSDPRLVRDAHLGSIWEGTSNIVALDVLRAARREGSLPVLQRHLQGLLDATAMHPSARTTFDRCVARATALVSRAAEAKADGEHEGRRAASALYHVSSAVAMAWEAGRLASPRRMALAQQVIAHRVLPRDPLADPAAEPAWLASLLDPALASPLATVDAVALI
jgi:acyl-CoA dehydrogenase